MFQASHLIIIGGLFLFCSQNAHAHTPKSFAALPRERESLNDGWRFRRWETNPDGFIYDHRPDLPQMNDTHPLKPWILPSANDFIPDIAQHYKRPPGNPADNVTYAIESFDDADWDTVNLPHDWAISGPFYTEDDDIAPVGGGMGRLPVQGVVWYRRKLSITDAPRTKSIYLELDGAMSYAMIWINGRLIGGWPYGYNSFAFDITQFLEQGDNNQLAIRLDNPKDSARWYPGGGLYRNVWLSTLDSTHVARYGTFITSREVSSQSAMIDLHLKINNKGDVHRNIQAITTVYALDRTTDELGPRVAEFPQLSIDIGSESYQTLKQSILIDNPSLWGPLPMQSPNLYAAVTEIHQDGHVIDRYQTPFGIRSLEFDPDRGLLVNGELIKIQGVNQHHDLGALGSAFNVRAAERQLETLHELGCNAIRMAHNPPASELLHLTDRMGFLVIDEIFDSWMFNKTDSDFHLIFAEWHEADLRSFIRRDRNHPSIVAWSYGNEVYEQYTNETGAALSKKLHDIVLEEDPTRPSTASINYARPEMDFPRPLDILSLNYQGAGIRDTNPYSNSTGIRTQPLYPAYHEKFPGKLILSSESASTLSSRGTYIFPVVDDISAPVNDTSGGDSDSYQVSSYDLYTAGFGSSPDKVFAAQDQNPFVAGEFVWTGWDYIGEPTPYYSARSSYSGIIDLAGFKKDRFYLYQSRWRSELPMAHILPHWNWPGREGQVTPVHVYSAADEAELFLNGISQGFLTREAFTYRFRWDDVTYEPGELHAVTYKNGEPWANDTVTTTGEPMKLRLSADRTTVQGDGLDLSFVTVEIIDAQGVVVPQANDTISFSIEGPAHVVATDNGNPADLVSFPSMSRDAFGGLALAVVRGEPGHSGSATLTAEAYGIGTVTIDLLIQ